MSKLFYLIHRSYHIRCFYSGLEWTWKQWQWRGTPHSPKPQHHCKLNIRLFSHIRTIFGVFVPLYRGAVGVFYSRLGNVYAICEFSYVNLKMIYINSHTSSTPIDLYEIPHIFTTWTILTNSLRTSTGYIYIYIYIHPQTECFVVSQIISMARHTRCFQLGSKPR